MNYLELFLGQIPEAVYFTLFMMYAKRLNNNRIQFALLMIAEYVLLINALPFSIWSHILYFITSYATLKILYKEKAQITDIFTFGLASLIMICTNILVYFAFYNNHFLAVMCDRIIIIMLPFILKRKLPKIQNMYKLFWNRNDSVQKPMKSTTFRCINLVMFNIMFYVINIFMLYCLFRR